MSKTATKKRTEQKRTEPYKKVQRKMLELTVTDDQVDMLLKQIEREFVRMKRAQQEYDEFVVDTVVKGIIEPGNEQLDPDDKQDSLTFYSTDGELRFSIGRQRKRFFDDRSHQAMVYLQDYINEYEAKQDDPDAPVILGFIKSLFFGSRNKKQFKWTPELQQFLQMEPKDLHDERLKKAQSILQSCLHIVKSKWYHTVERYDEEEREYKTVEA